RRRAAERGAHVEVRTEVPRGGQPIFFAAADFFVFPGDTIQEAVPTAIAEALASGLPIVANDWDGTRDIVQHEVTGLLVPTALGLPPDELSALFPASDFLSDFLIMGQSVSVDRKALGEAIQRLLTNPALRQTMGRKAREFAESRLALRDWTPGMVALANELLNQAKAEPTANVERRRQAAERSPMAMPFGRIFQSYATNTIDPEDPIRLTADGQKALQGRATPSFYDACLPYLTPLVVPALLRAVEGEQTFGPTVERAAEEAHISREWTRFALLLLIKHGFVQRFIRPKVI
ncbi:glycosyltransferase, partial [bacterium]